MTRLNQIRYVITLIPFGLSAQMEFHGFSFDGETREFAVFLPQAYEQDEEQGLPLAVNLHGYGGQGLDQMTFSGMNAVADTAGFIIAYPEAVDQVWNSGIADNDQWPTPNVDDVGFIDTMIDSIQTWYGIDMARIYICGMSNGGFMTYRLACHMSHRLAAVAAVSGVMSASVLADCEPEQHLPLLHIHGTADTILPYGGLPPGWISVDETIDLWTDLNACTNPDTITVTNSDPHDGSTVQHIIYQDCAAGNAVELFQVLNGGHTWPGSAYEIFPEALGHTNYDINASEEILMFFREHDRSILLGDLNGDDFLNVLDIVQAVACVMDESSDNCGQGDINADGVMDILDVVALMNMVLSG